MYNINQIQVYYLPLIKWYNDSDFTHSWHSRHCNVTCHRPVYRFMEGMNHKTHTHTNTHTSTHPHAYTQTHSNQSVSHASIRHSYLHSSQVASMGPSKPAVRRALVDVNILQIDVHSNHTPKTEEETMMYYQSPLQTIYLL
jgi:hypothetical protein